MTSPLARALEAFEKGDEEAALEACLVAWRASRSTRIADLIDRLSEPLVVKDGPVKGKTVKARTAAWLELAPDASARTIGRLLATPWPGKWEDACDPLAAILKWPADPRVAMALAKTLQATPWDTYRSHAFYVPLVAHLGKLGDRRTLPILEADLERTKSHYWERSTKPSVAAAAKTVAAAEETALPPAEEASLVALLAHFASDVSTEIANEKSEDELLAAIYAAPDDDGPRIVYADWLMERNDPRGELITLQLASNEGSSEEREKRKKRATTLLRKHGDGWLGPLAAFVHKKVRVFERGFLAIAGLEIEGRELPRGVDDPAWSTVHTLSVGWDEQYYGLAPQVLALPSLQHLRRLIGVQSNTLAALPLRPALEELDILVNHQSDVEPILAKGESFPNVRRLGIEGELERVEILLGGALARRVEMVTLYGSSSATGLGKFLRLIEKLALSNVNEARGVGSMYPGGDPWRFAMCRDKRGQLTVFHGVSHWSERGSGSVYELLYALRGLEPDQLTSFAIDRSEPSTFSANDIRQVETELERFPDLASIEVPWERLAKPKPVDPSLVPALLRLSRAEPYDAATYEKLWNAVEAKPLELRFDGYNVNATAHQALPADGLAVVHKARAKKRTWNVAVYRSDAPDRLEIALANVTIHGLVRREPAAMDRYLEWLGHLSSELGASGSIPFVALREIADAPSRWEAQHAFRRITALNNDLPGWVWILAAEKDETYPFAELEKLRERLPWLRTLRAPLSLLLVMGATPADVPTPEQLEELDVALWDVRWAAYEKKHGLRPHRKVEEAFAPVLDAHGFKRKSLGPLADASGKLAFVSITGTEARWIYTEPYVGLDDVVLYFNARHSRTNPEADLTEWDQVERNRLFGPNANRVTDAESMSRIAREATVDLATALRWFDETDPPRKRRR